MLRRSLFLSPDAPAAPAAPAPPATPPVRPEQRASDFVTRMIAQHGSVENALQQTAMRLFAAEDSGLTHERTITELRGKLPGEGALVLPKAEAVEYAKVIALKLTPDQIVERVKKAGELETTVATRTLTDEAKAAGTAHGFDPDATAAMALAKGLHVEAKDTQVTEKGKTVTKKVYHVRPAADDKAALVPLTDYTAKLPAFEQRALAATAPTPLTLTGPEYPTQRPTPTSGDPTDLVGAELQKINERAKARPNPLFPVRAPAGTAA